MANRVIWKFMLAVKDEQEIQMPKGAEVLSVHSQMDTPTIWARVDPSASVVFRKIHIRGTGHRLNGEEGDFIGTCLEADDEALVWHVFIVPE